MPRHYTFGGLDYYNSSGGNFPFPFGGEKKSISGEKRAVSFHHVFHPML